MKDKTHKKKMGGINKGKVNLVHCCLLGPDKNSIPVTQAQQKQEKLKQLKGVKNIQQMIK